VIGNFHAQFLEDWTGAIPSGYSVILELRPYAEHRPGRRDMAEACRSLFISFLAVGDEQARYLIVSGVCVGAQVVGDEDFS
jgi:hypothetical protein